MDNPKYHLVSLSGGKDSTAMLLGMIERGMQIDCILFCDTGLEFPAMYDHLDKLERDIGRPITRIPDNCKLHNRRAKKRDSLTCKEYCRFLLVIFHESPSCLFIKA